MTKEEQKNTRDTNMKLLAVFKEWEIKSRFIDVACENNLSCPYVCSVSERYSNAKNRIMIIGQETFDFPLFDDNSSEQSIQTIQTWGVEYLEKQLWNIGNQRYNRSAFWKLFRYVESNIGYCPCWNNVDKAHRIIGGKTVPLTTELEKTLNATALSNGDTILLNEIAIAKPSAILFITGPNYYQSMAAAMRIDENKLYSLKPTVDCVCSDISEITKLGLPVLWTYHPTFLNLNERNKQLFSRSMNAIKQTLQKSGLSG